MPDYGVSANGVAAASAAPYATFHTGASYRARIWYIAFSNTTAVAPSVQLIRPNNTPVATTSNLGQALNPNDPASTCNLDTTWSTAPTISGVPLDGIVMSNLVGAGLIWDFSRAPLELNVSSWLVFWNFGGATGPLPRISLRWTE